jgi:hypothetical protein
MALCFAAVEEAGGGSYSDGGEAADSPGRSPSKRAKVRLFEAEFYFKITDLFPVLGIWIRMFLRFFYHQAIVRKTLIFYCFVTSL